jgi:membrane-associated phospholipid phosphatase
VWGLIIYGQTSGLVVAKEAPSPATKVEPAKSADAVEVEENSFGKKLALKDLGDTVSYTARGSYLQFTAPHTQFLGLLGAATVIFLYQRDDHYSRSLGRQLTIHGYQRFISNVAILFGTPIVPLLSYSYGHANDDKKMMSFSKEYLATSLLALGESALLSFVPIHERPDSEHVTVWEKKFRSKSSFPSGHVIGFSALSLKLFQYYGPMASILPMAASLITADERIASRKHYLTDVVGSYFLVVMASEGVRMATGANEYYHPTYQWLLKNEFGFAFITRDRAKGVAVNLTF